MINMVTFILMILAGIAGAFIVAVLEKSGEE